ncbi:hypothetical protein EDD86DRAFT_244546 [Gorgonomyces haynaldii]|nr:hypothetical protein EDD86DRAFT_244546 [Gorgonomyces haynaldii]
MPEAILFTANTATLLFFYAFVLGLDCSVIGTILGSWKVLPARFRQVALCTVFVCLIGFSTLTSSLFISPDLCAATRKPAYVFFYIGYMLYDYYQLCKILAITSASKRAKIIFHILLLLRLASFIVSLVNVTGTKFEGSCRTLFSTPVFYQEHVVGLLFQGSLFVQFFGFIHTAKPSSDGEALSMLKSVLDYEIISFSAYFVCEAVFLIVFSIITPNQVSFLNAFYLSLPVVLFFSTLIAFANRNAQLYKKMVAQSIA